jgi:potassium/hydrogen antiporter
VRVSDYELILVAGLLLAAGLAAAKAADRLRVPGLLLFLGLGMLAGSEGLGGIDFDDAELTRTLGTVALVLILFEGGLAAGWQNIRPVIGAAVSLAVVGTLATSVIAGLAAALILDLGTLESMIVGAAIGTTDSAAIFAVLRGSRLRRKIARALEGESGMNDPVAVLLVVGFIAWLEEPAFGLEDMAFDLASNLAVGAVLGVGLGFAARTTFRRLNLPTAGLYPVASIAAVGLAFGLTEALQGSGFLAVYLTGLILGTGALPAKQTVLAFHQGVAWVSQISLFFLLGLLVFPSDLGAVAPQGLLLSAALMLVARPAAVFLSTTFGGFELRERLMLGWAGLRGAVPVWLATFAVIAGVDAAGDLFSIVFFVVLTSTLIQGATFEPLARTLGLTTTEPALPRLLVEPGTIRRLGGEVLAYRVSPGDAAVGRMIKELELPREALVNVVVRGGTAIPPRGSTEIQPGDELHILVRQDSLGEVEGLTERWRNGPLGEPGVAQLPLRAAPQVFSARPLRAGDDDPARPERIDGVAVAARLRSRRDAGGALVALADGRYAVTGAGLLAVGSRRQLASWCARRGDRPGLSAQERAWWQEVTGALSAPPSPRRG